MMHLRSQCLINMQSNTVQRKFFLCMFILWLIDFCLSEINCPTKCVCSPSEVGTTFVNCSKGGLLQIPGELPEAMSELELDSNVLGKIGPDTFPYTASLKSLLVRDCQLKRVIFEPENLPKLAVLDLSQNALKVLPSGLPSGLQTLILNENLISEITGDSFLHLDGLKELYCDHNGIDVVDEMTFKLVYSKHTEAQQLLPNLKKLSLCFNSIKIVADKAFEDLKNLKALNLAHNKLKIVGSEMFVGLELLQYLDLSNNRLSSVYGAAFMPLKNLVSLKLHHNKLTEIPERLPMLEWLDVSFNRIRTLSESHKSEIMAVENFVIGQNPFHCDCHLLWLKELYDRRAYILKHLTIEPSDFIPVCSSPKELVGDSWDVLTDAVFVCSEKTSLENIDSSPQSEEFDPKHFKVHLEKATDELIKVRWDMKSLHSFYSVFLQYYKFGEKGKSLQYVEIAANQRQYSLKRLLPETNYVICVIPKLDDKDDVSTATPLAFHHCLEVTTPRSEVIYVLSYFWVLCYYILGMAGTIIFVLTATGLVALLCGLLLPKDDWSAEYVVDDPSQDGTRQSTNVDAKTSSDVRDETPGGAHHDRDKSSLDKKLN